MDRCIMFGLEMIHCSIRCQVAGSILFIASCRIMLASTLFDKDTMEPLDERDIEPSKKGARGITLKPEIAINRSNGIKETVRYNKKGQPYGKEATNLISALGMIVRSTVPITANDWRKDVFLDMKEKMWLLIEKSFVLDPRSKKNIISSMGHKFRSFKNTLTTFYILPFKNDPQHLKYPPELYNFIPQLDWDAFVSSQLSDEFMALRDTQQERRSKHRYPHRLGRKGYAVLAVELNDELGSIDDEVDRSILWKKARQKANGKYDPAAEPIVEKIQSKEGILEIAGDHDILTQALGTPEHCGRVRSVGKFVTPTSFFHTPRAPTDWEKREKSYIERLAILEETVRALTQQQPPMPHLAVSSNNVLEKLVKDTELKKTAPVVVENREDKTCQLALISKDNIIASGTILEYRSPNVLVVIEVVWDRGARLPLENDDGLVTVNDGVGHHVLWPEELVLHTSIKPTKKIVNNHEKVAKTAERASIVNDSLLEVHKKLPKIHTSLPNIQKHVPAIQRVVPKIHRVVPNIGPSLPEIHTSIPNMKRPIKHPPAIEMFAKLVERCVVEDSSIRVDFDDDTFGYNCFTYISQEEFLCLTSMIELPANCIMLYIRHLYDQIKDEGLDKTFGFMNPAVVSLAGLLETHKKQDERSRNIADRLQKAKKNQLILVPYNPGFHWVLAVIDLFLMTAYYLDSLRGDITGISEQL